MSKMATAVDSILMLGKKTYRSIFAFKTFLCRPYSKTQFCLYKQTTQTERKSRILKKLLSREQASKKKKWHGSTFKINTPYDLGEKKQVVNPRRINILNAMFMEKITEVMSTGEIGSELQGYNIEILFVKVSANFQHASVYWAATGCDPVYEEKIQHLLNSYAPRIRSELISQHLLGIVPLIAFVKDKIYSRASEVERLLAVADFGEDIKIEAESKLEIPPSLQESVQETADISKTDVSYHYKSLVPLNNKTSEQEQKMENECKLFQDYSNDYSRAVTDNRVYPPDMRMDIFGLDHRALMDKVMKNCKIRHRKVIPEQTPGIYLDSDSEQEIPGIALSSACSSDRDARFKNFLLSRKKMKVKEQTAIEDYSYEICSQDLHEVEETDDDYFDEEHYNSDEHCFSDDTK